MRSSKRRKLASRANGALSKGPKTPEGKARSSYNAVRHGMLAKCVVLDCENEDVFHKLVDQFVRRFEPLDDVEFGMVEEMAACHWRMRRGWVVEKELMNDAVQKYTDGVRSADSCIAAAFTDLAATPQRTLLTRYESRLNRQYHRALCNLMQLRAQKAAATQAAAVETKEDSAAETAKTESGQTKLIPQTNTPSEPLPNSGQPASTPEIPGKEPQKLPGTIPGKPGKPSPDDIAA